jgi:polyhydroxyalkanoate synthesis regulator phasin
MEAAVGLAGSAAGFLSLAIEVTKILTEFVNNVKLAPEEARALSTEVSTLCHIAETLVELLRSDDPIDGVYNDEYILYSIIEACRGHMVAIQKRLLKLSNCDTEKSGNVMGRLKWPFHRDECMQTVQTLRHYVQTLQVLLI